MDFEAREQELTSFLKELNGAGTLTSMDYQLNVDKFVHPMESGTIIFTYSDKSTTEVPFNFVTMGEGNHKTTQVDLSRFLVLRSSWGNEFY